MPKYMSFEQCSEEAQTVIEAYFRAEYAGLLSFARKLNLNENLAEEAVQEAFVIFLRNYERWKTRKLEPGWLYGVLKNIAMHILRDENETKLRCISLEDVVYEPGMEEPGYHFAQHPPDDPDLQLLKRFYIDENDPWNVKTYMVRAADCVENYPGKEVRVNDIKE